MTTTQAERFPGTSREGLTNFAVTRMEVDAERMEKEVLGGLRNTPKAIPPKYLYDAKGSRLFDQICDLREYYLTRSEIAILRGHADAILQRMGHNLCLIEPGAGACQKAQLLLDTGRVSAFVPVDISARYLEHSALTVAANYPRVSVHAIATDFLSGLPHVNPALPAVGRRVIFYPGSSIGNFDPPDTVRLLRQFHALLRYGDGLLIGYDLQKDPGVLSRAYNDSAGITARFNLNLLARLNRELGADFNLEGFRHVALYNKDRGRIEMHLESLVPQQARIADEFFRFARLERIHTESSYKYTVEGFDAMAVAVGFHRLGLWTDGASYFAVALYARNAGGNGHGR